MQDSQRDALVGDSPTPSASIPRAEQRPTALYRRVRTLKSFQYRNFRMFWATMFGMSVSGWVISVTIGWLTFQLTNSPLLTGLAIGMAALPPVVVGPVAGVLIDSFDRRKILAGALASHAAIIAVFGIIVILGVLQPWHIFVMAFLTGVSGSFLGPAEQALLPNVVPKGLLVNAFALVAFAGSVTRLIAPAATGFLIVLIGPGETLMLAVVFNLIAIKSALMIDVKNENRHTIKPKMMLKELAEAARFMKNTKIVMALTVLIAALLMFVTPINFGLMPVFAADVFSAGPQILGLLVAALGGGMSIGTIVLASIGHVERRGIMIVGAAGLTALGVIAFSLTGSLLLAFPTLVLYGAAMVITWTVVNAVIQSMVPDKLRGRVAALTATVHVTFPIGTLFVGGLAELYGVQTAALISGLAMLAVVFAVPIVFRGVWSFRSEDNSEEPTAEDEDSVPPTETLEPQTV